MSFYRALSINHSAQGSRNNLGSNCELYYCHNALRKSDSEQIGGAFIDSNATWRWVSLALGSTLDAIINVLQAFYLNLVVGGIFAPVYLFLLPSIDLQHAVALKQRLQHHVDWLGILFHISGISCFTLATTFGGSVFPWSSAGEIALWVLAGALLLMFGLTQWLHPLVNTRHILYPVAFFRRPVVLMLQLAIFMSSASLLV